MDKSMSSSQGRLPAKSPMAEKFEKYYFHSDSSLKDRIAALAPPPPGKVNIGPEPSVFSTSGWDKYYFYSIPADNSVIGATCRQGRSRPAASGPNTFAMEAFSPEVVARERKRLEARGALTNYSELFSQIPRATNATNFPLRPSERRPVATVSRFGKDSPAAKASALARAASDSVLRKEEPVIPEAPPPAAAPAAAESSSPSKSGKLLRDGPFWPPKEKVMPDSLQTRTKLFGGEHRTFVDLYSKEIPAASGFHYTIFTG